MGSRAFVYSHYFNHLTIKESVLEPSVKTTMSPSLGISTSLISFSDSLRPQRDLVSVLQRSSCRLYIPCYHEVCFLLQMQVNRSEISTPLLGQNTIYMLLCSVFSDQTIHLYIYMDRSDYIKSQTIPALPEHNSLSAFLVLSSICAFQFKLLYFSLGKTFYSICESEMILGKSDIN